MVKVIPSTVIVGNKNGLVLIEVEVIHSAVIVGGLQTAVVEGIRCSAMIVGDWSGLVLVLAEVICSAVIVGV